LSLREHVNRLVASSAVRYLAIGSLSFVLDFGLLALCYRVFGWPLWLSTATGFWGSFFFNFFLQRRFSFKSESSLMGGAFRYSILLGVNTVATIGIVGFFENVGAGILVGKLVATGATTVWNYFLYKHWVFSTTRLRDLARKPEGDSDQSTRDLHTSSEG
jgi:putative flippase GtrA